MTVIGIGGRLRAGKDEVAKILGREHDYVVMGMSDPLREHLRIVNPWIKVTLREAWRLRIRPGFHRAADLLQRLGYTEAKTVRDLREFMQRDGTEGGRKFFGENVWVDKLRSMIQEDIDDGFDVAITGLRYPNEITMIEDLGGATVWVHRPGVEAPSVAAGSHSSENSVGEADFEYAVDNVGTLVDLSLVVDELVRFIGRRS